MAFFGKVGNVLRQTVSKQLISDLKPASPSVYQAIRCMSSSKLFIGGLSYGTDESSLQEAFSNYGQVVEARIILDRETGRSRGFGFVTYTSSEEASAAIQALDGQDLHGRRVRVNYATDRAPRMSPGYGPRGNSYGGPYGGGSGAGYGGYDNAGGNFGGGGYQNSGYGTGGGPGNYNQGGFGGYGGQNSSPGSFGAGDGGSGFGGYGGQNSSPGSFGAGVGGSGSDSFASGENIGSAGGAGGNVSAGSGFASSGFEEGSGLGHSGGDQFGGFAGSPMNDNAGEPAAPIGGEFKDGSESGLPVDKEDDYEPDDYAKRA